MPGAFGQNGGSIKLVNDAYVLGLGRGPYAKPSGQRPDSARPAVRPWPTGPSPGIRTCLVLGSPFPPIQTVTSKLSLSTVTRYNINALYLGDLKTHRGQGKQPMPTTTPADPVVEEDRVCPECSSEHLVRDYTRGELVCDSCGLVISESAIDEGPEWAAYSVEENDRLARTGVRKKTIGKAYGALLRTLTLRVPPSRPSDYVSRFCSRLGLSNTVEAESQKILKELEKIDSSMSLSPSGTAAAAIYLASLASGERRPQKAIAKIAGVSEVTLRNRFQFMEGFMEQLILPRGRAPKVGTGNQLSP